MSLLEEFKEAFCFMDPVHSPDGEGGTNVTWNEGASINITMRHDTSIQALMAEKQGVTSTFTFLAPKGSSIKFHDVLKRLSDGQCFRITSNANDTKTPASATFSLTAITAEKWDLT